MGKRLLPSLLVTAGLVILGLVFAFLGPADWEIPETVGYYPEFVEKVEAGRVEEAAFTGRAIEARLEDGTLVRTIFPADAEASDLLMEHGVPITAQEERASILDYSPVILVALLLFMVAFHFRNLRRQPQGQGQSVKKEFEEAQPGLVSFADVAGIEEEKLELQEVVDFLQEPGKYDRLGAEIPRGILLIGPAGTGKTLLGRAVAGEAGVPFFNVSGSDFVEMYVGVGASRIRKLFDQAKARAPCVVFIDELDAVGRQRGAGLGGGHDEKEQTLNQLLVAMDGFEPNQGVVVLGATNRPDILDPALLRPGRFDRRVVVGRPDLSGREEILKVHTRKRPLSPQVKLEDIARRTPGFTGADLANLVNEAALLAARRDKDHIGEAELEESVDRVLAGTEKRSRVMTDEEKAIAATHEAGHALAAFLLPHADPVRKVSVVPRGLTGGYTQTVPDLDRYYATKSQLVDRITTLLAGRVAEEATWGEVSTGAQNDLERATEIAKSMVMEYGMSEELGLFHVNGRQQVFLGRDLAQGRETSEETAREIELAVRRILEQCRARAESMVQEYGEQHRLMAEKLQEREVLYREEIEDILDRSGRSGE